MKAGIIFREDGHAKWLLGDGVMQEIVKNQSALIAWAKKAQIALEGLKCTNGFYAPFISVAVASCRGRPRDFEGSYIMIVPHTSAGDPYIQWECSNIYRKDVPGDLLSWVVADINIEGKDEK